MSRPQVLQDIDDLQRRQLSSETTLYVTTSGNDTTGDGSSSKPYRTITKALSVLPKNLNDKNATINIGAGTYAEDVRISRFYGGKIVLRSTSTGTSVTVKSLRVINSIVYIENTYLSTNTSGVYVAEKGDLHVSSRIVISGGSIGLIAEEFSSVHIEYLSVSNTTYALYVVESSKVSLGTLTGSNNTVVADVLDGGTLTYESAAIPGYQIFMRTSTGGRVYSGAQTSLPVY